MRHRGLISVLLATLTASAIPAAPAEESAWRFEGAARAVAFGDVHGAYDELVIVLRETGLIDGDLKWSGGKAHLVSLGDIVDRGPDSRKALDLLMRLESEAAAAGGRVHTVLGNHEAMNLVGDLRYVTHEEFAAFAKDETKQQRDAAFAAFGARRSGATREQFDAAYPPGYFAHRAAFLPTGRYGRWLLERPVVVVVDGTAFVHGGLPPMLLELEPDALGPRLASELREFVALRDRLVARGVISPLSTFAEAQTEVVSYYEKAVTSDSGKKKKKRRKKSDESGEETESESVVRDAKRYIELLDDALALHPEGPLWYRGHSLHPPAAERTHVEAALRHFGAKRLVVGHTFDESRRAVSRLGGLVTMVDTGMQKGYYDGRPSALVVTDGGLEVVYPEEGLREPPRTLEQEQATAESGDRSAVLFWSDARLEEFLRTAEIVKKEEVGKGITRPLRLTLTDGETTVRAAFKTFDSFKSGPVQKNPLQRINLSDRYQYDVAAYRLDRLLGLNLVPVCVLRKVDGREGTVQLWIENAIDEEKRLELGKKPPDPRAHLLNRLRRDIFDVLIHNVDRNQGNILYTEPPWRFHLIDHTRAFRTFPNRPATLRQRNLVLFPELERKLLLLDEDRLEEHLGEHLDSRQLTAILKRRNGLLEDDAQAQPGR